MTVGDLLHEADALIAALRGSGHADAADTLSSLKGSAWTTSSEMIGELGLVVLRLKAQSGLPADVVTLADRLMREVRKVWPGIKLP